MLLISNEKDVAAKMTIEKQEMRAERLIGELLKMKEQMLTNRSVMTALIDEGKIEVEGCYVDGKLNGVITLQFDNGTMQLFCEDNIASNTVNLEIGSLRFVGSLPEGAGNMTFTDGSRYVGMVRNFEPHGSGTMYNSNGTWERGEWYHGQLLTEASFDVNSGVIH